MTMGKPPGGGGGSRAPSQEYMLLDYLQRLGKNLEGRRAVHIHLSRLRPQNRRNYHIKIAAATFEGIVQNFEGQTFIMSNSDIFFVCKGASVTDIDTAVMKVRFLFSEDPLSQGEDEEDLARFCTWYNLELQYDEVFQMVQQAHRERERKSRLSVSAEQAAEFKNKSSRKPIDPEQLGKLEGFL